MKSYSKYLAVIIIFSSCGENRAELDEFVRLERELVKDCIQYDSAYFTNRYKENDRQTEYTDSIIDISDAYDSLILKTKKRNYVSEMNFIKSKLSRRIKFNTYRWNRYAATDTTLEINDSLDVEFIKSSERIHMSRIFDRLSSGFQWGCITYYEPRNYTPIYQYRKSKNSIVGEFNMGEKIIVDHNTTEINLSKNQVLLKPISYEKDSFMTSATFQPIDTGIYTLRISHFLDIYTWGKDSMIFKTKTIYVKP